MYLPVLTTTLSVFRFFVKYLTITRYLIIENKRLSIKHARHYIFVLVNDMTLQMT